MSVRERHQETTTRTGKEVIDLVAILVAFDCIRYKVTQMLSGESCFLDQHINDMIPGTHTIPISPWQLNNLTMCIIIYHLKCLLTHYPGY